MGLQSTLFHLIDIHNVRLWPPNLVQPSRLTCHSASGKTTISLECERGVIVSGQPERDLFGSSCIARFYPASWKFGQGVLVDGLEVTSVWLTAAIMQWPDKSICCAAAQAFSRNLSGSAGVKASAMMRL